MRITVSAFKNLSACQTLEASQAIARLHGLNNGCVVFAQQNPLTIDAGVFHNDVISVGNRNVLFYHQAAFLDTDGVLSSLDRELAAVNPATLMSDALYERLVSWVNTHYRDRLSTQDLADPQLLVESRTALDALTQILQVGSIYDFQRP